MRNYWMLFPVLIVGLIAFAILPGQSTDAPKKQSSDLLVAIAIDEDESAVSKIPGKLRIPIVFLNQGSKPLRIWKEWCSWGWFNLTFEIKRRGKTVTLGRGGREWAINFPDFWTLAPKQALVRYVTLGSSGEDEWDEWGPLDGEDWDWRDILSPGEHKMRFRAIYEVHEDKESKENGVWSGKVTSEEHEYVIRIPAPVDVPRPKR